MTQGIDVVVPLWAVDGRSESSDLTLRLVTKDGVTFLEVDTHDAVLPPDATFWRTDTDGRTTGLHAAVTDVVFGFRFPDTRPDAPVEVVLSVIDGSGLVLQTSPPVPIIA